MKANTKIVLSGLAAAMLTFTGCGGSGTSTGGTTTNTTTTTNTSAEVDCSGVSYTTPSSTTLAGDITSHTLLTSSNIWTLDGLVAVKNNTCLKIQAGTIIEGKAGTADNTSYLVVDKGSKLIAVGTATDHIVFRGQNNSLAGEWGGVTLIGNDANAQVQPYEVNTAFVAGTGVANSSSGALDYVEILNSGISMSLDKEINGLSMIGVGSGTTVSNLIVDKSDDDCVEIWGGSVNLSNVTLSGCTDDHFDIDDGWTGTVTGLTINQTTGNAAIEMSGNTYGHFVNLTITQDISAKEGVIFFKNAGIGGHFDGATVIDNVIDSNGVLHSNSADVDSLNTSFTNCTFTNDGSNTGYTGGSAAILEAKFLAGSANTMN